MRTRAGRAIVSGRRRKGPSFIDCLTHGSSGVLPAGNRMTRSAEFSYAVKHGVRASQPDLVVHACRDADGSAAAPRIGFIVSKSVNAVDRHRVARRLRHAVRAVITELDPGIVSWCERCRAAGLRFRLACERNFE